MFKKIISLANVLCLGAMFSPALASDVTSIGAPFYARILEQDIYEYFGVRVQAEETWIDYLNNQLAEFNYPTDFKTIGTNHLFRAYPKLANTLPYLSFASLPTPITKLEQISAQYGVQVFIKNDAFAGGTDQAGTSIYGGNKLRKLEFLLAHAKALGAKKMAALGCVGSNYAMAMTVHARNQGFDAVDVLLIHQPPSRAVQHNLLMQQAYGAKLHYSANASTRRYDAINMWLNYFKQDGQVPYLTPIGGSNARGAIGFVNAAFELAEQIKQGVMPKPTHIYVTTCSCGTTAGLLLGCKAAGLDVQIVAIAAEPDQVRTFSEKISTLFKQTNDLLRSMDNSFPDCAYGDQDLKIDLNFTGPGYGVFTSAGMQASAQILAYEGIALDGTYTAKGFAGLLDHVSKNPHQVALFWNTYSGLDFSDKLKDQDYKKMPKCLHAYFDDINLQELAQ